MNRRRRYQSSGDVLALAGFLVFVIAALVTFILYNTDLLNQSESLTTAEITPEAAPPTADANSEPSITVDTGNQLQSYDSIENARILIPAAGINAAVINVYLDGVSWDVSRLGMNVGHLQGTKWMGEGAGNIVLSGHVEMRDGRKGIFAGIETLAEGDVIILQQDGREQHYSVLLIDSVDPSDLTPIYPTEQDQLTLITCDDYDFLRDSYLERTIVVAERIS